MYFLEEKKVEIHRILIGLKILSFSVKSSYATLLPYLEQQSNRSDWYKTKIWFRFCDNLDYGKFRAAKKSFLLAQFNELREASDYILLSFCRPSPQLDPIMLLPMTNFKRSLFLR